VTGSARPALHILQGAHCPMLARLATTALVGLVAHPVGVEVDIGRGLPAVTVVGLGDTAVLQARDRIRAAFGNAGFKWPDRRVTVSLPPSDLPKHGPGFDVIDCQARPC
jgi:magnesium chelatase family protein